MDNKKPDPVPDSSEKMAAMLLLRATLNGDMRMVDTLISADVNANCRFDRIPLLCIAAAQGVSLDIIKRLEEGGADARLGVEAGGSKHIGYRPYALASDPETKAYLEKKCYAAAKRDLESDLPDAPEPRAPDDFTWGANSKDWQRFLLEEPEYYWKDNWPSWEKSRDNGIAVVVHHDSVLDLLENSRKIVAVEKDKSVTAAEIEAQFSKADKPNMN